MLYPLLLSYRYAESASSVVVISGYSIPTSLFVRLYWYNYLCVVFSRVGAGKGGMVCVRLYFYFVYMYMWV